MADTATFSPGVFYECCGKLVMSIRIVASPIFSVQQTLHGRRGQQPPVGAIAPSVTVYVSWTKDRRRLRFSKSGDPNIEQAYSTHWRFRAVSASPLG